MFTREELQHITAKALEEANLKGLSQSWRHVWLKLANAADYADAMVARTEVKEVS